MQVVEAANGALVQWVVLGMGIAELVGGKGSQSAPWHEEST